MLVMSLPVLIATGRRIGLISDTAILSSGLNDVKVSDRVRAQLPWSLICVALAAVTFFTLSTAMGLPTTSGDPSTILANLPAESIAALEAERPSVLILLKQVETGVPIYLLIPVVVVIVMTCMRFETMICLTAGIFLSIIFGFLAGTVMSLEEVLGFIQGGLESAGSWAVIMLFWAMGFGGIMRRMNAFQPIAEFFLRTSKRVRHLVTWNGLLCLLMNATINEEMSQMACVGPVMKSIINDNVEGSEENKYRLRNRCALFSGAVGVHSACRIPWHTGVAYYVGLTMAIYIFYRYQISNLYYNFMSIFCVISIYIFKPFKCAAAHTGAAAHF